MIDTCQEQLWDMELGNGDSNTYQKQSWIH